MNKETIDKAAWDYAENIPQPDERRKYSWEDFIAGARWRINAAWHSTDEPPKHSDYLAVLMSNGLMETMYYNVGIRFSEMQLKGYVSWAYVADLIPDLIPDEVKEGGQ